MKRRQLIHYGGVSILTALGLTGAKTTLAQSSRTSVTITYLGHTCFLFAGSGLRVLVNPFRPIGCTAKYPSPKVPADLVLISSFLLDEGAVEEVAGNPRIITKSGDYKIQNIRFQGITTPHDKEGGRRFGNNIVWGWNQGGVRILHLGGAAAPIGVEEKILMGRPDVLLIPVGGGAKSYNPEEAKQAINVLNPRVVIPTQYRTKAADENACDLVGVDEFLKLASGMGIKRLNTNKISIRPSDLPAEGTLIRVLRYS